MEGKHHLTSRAHLARVSRRSLSLPTAFGLVKLGLGMCLTVALSLQATPTNSTDTGFDNLHVLTFNALSPSGSSTGPVQVGDEVDEDIIWSASPAAYSAVDNAAFGNNYAWNFSGRGLFAASAIDQGNPVHLRFDFNSGPVSAVGAFLNYSTGDYNGNFGSVVFVLEALDYNGDVLETYDILTGAAITATANNDGAFRGIVRDANDIYAVQFRSDGRFFAVDDLSFSRLAAVPEPASFALILGLASLGVLFVGRRIKVRRSGASKSV